MNSKEYVKIVEAYQSVYEQQKIGIDASKEGGPDKLLQKIINKDPKKYGGGEVIRSGLQKANYEPEMDLFDYLLEYLVAEGYADTNKAALAIMANMSEEWKQSIVENRGMAYSGGKPGASGDGSRPKGITGGKTYQMPGWNDKGDKKQVKDA